MFTVEIAGIPIDIDNHFGLVELQCKDYLTSRPAVFKVSTSAEDMLRENGTVSAYAESLCLYRRIALGMLEHQGFLMHAAVIDLDGQGIAFAAKSGTGKTTRVLLWKKALGGRVRVVNGDKPILRFIDDTLYAFGTPWMGKEDMGENTCVPLNYVCFLERGEEVSLRRLDPQEILPRLFGQVLMPKDERQVNLLIPLLNRFIEQACFLLLTCNMEKEDPEHLWAQMKSIING